MWAEQDADPRAWVECPQPAETPYVGGAGPTYGLARILQSNITGD
jgi:hypothetical protein